MATDDGVSDYEKLRLANIARNEAALKQLGVPTLLPAKRRAASKKPAAKRAAAGTPREGSRKSSRTVSATRKVVIDGDEEEDDGSDFEAGGDDDDDDDDDEDEAAFEQARRRRKSSAAASAGVSAAAAQLPLPGEQTDVLAVELAKTGRSKCRGCYEPIAQGEPRIGMQAWIMGRQSMTWSHPQCCIAKLCVAVEATGRGKCKLTGQALPRGQPKLGVRSHTATSWVVLAGTASVLAPVLRVVPTAQQARVLALLGSAAGASPTIEGFDSLSADHAAAVVVALQSAAATVKATSSKVESTTPDQQTSPSLQSGKLTGRVAWKFGGATCYGDMIPSRETATHCYATTHKGNVKTLAKGKSYWWLLEK